jgi:hypothetical protein
MSLWLLSPEIYIFYKTVVLEQCHSKPSVLQHCSLDGCNKPVGSLPLILSLGANATAQSSPSVYGSLILQAH